MGKLIIFLLLLSSCSSRHIQRSRTTVDSTVNTTAHVTIKDINIESATRTVTVKDSSGQRVVFGAIPSFSHTGTEPDSLRVMTEIGPGSSYGWDTSGSVLIGRYFASSPGHTYPQPNTVKFSKGRIVEASGNIKEATAIITRDANREDSLYTLVQIQHDSIATLQATKHVETKMVEKNTRSWWWLWLIIGLVAGYALRHYLAKILYNLFGKIPKNLNCNIMLLSIFGGGLWIIPLLTTIGFVVFLRAALKASHSGSKQQTATGTTYSDENVPIHKTGQFWFAIVCAIATVVIVIAMIGDR